MMDLAYLESICEGDRAKMRAYMALYLEEAPALFDRVQEAWAGQDHEALAAVAHSLRPIVNTMGFAGLFERLSSLESLARSRDAAAFTLANDALEMNSALMSTLKEVLAKPD